MSRFPGVDFLDFDSLLTTYEGTHDIHGLAIGEAVAGIPAHNPPQQA